MKSPMMKKNTVYIFTDGACSYNPGPGGYGAIVLDPNSKVTELAGGEKSTTNNRMEITAAIVSLNHVSDFTGYVRVYTDSKYLINASTKWLKGWKLRGWKTSSGGDVLNQDLWVELEKAVNSLKAQSLEWVYVPGHAGHPGNERADELAVAFSKNQNVTLFKGRYSNYDHDLLKDIEKLDKGEFKKKTKSGSSSKKKAHSYLSLVDGKIEIHKTWPECEARVKGRSGVKFKKALSPTHEDEIYKEFSS